jgi:hypothetical protein
MRNHIGDGAKKPAPLTSKSAHVSTDEWFDFGGGSDNLPSSSAHSLDEFGGDFGGDSSADAGANAKRAPPRTRSGLTRGLSERRMEFKAQSLHIKSSSRDLSDETPQRGVPRAKSGDNSRSSREAPRSRVAPSRSRSDALTSARRESMRALYRVEEPGKGLGLDSSNSDLDNSASELNDGSAPRRRPPARTRPPTRTRSGLEGAGLSGVMDRQRRPPMRSKSTDSANLFSPQEDKVASDDELEQQDPKWLEKRKNKMDEIMSLAQDVKERFVEERERQEELEIHAANQGDGTGEVEDDDDQPMAMRTKKTALEKLKKVATKTGGGMRSLGKGTVNAIHDPKLAAKRFGHLSKDVGKATVKTALDPKKMAKGAKKVTVCFVSSIVEGYDDAARVRFMFSNDYCLWFCYILLYRSDPQKWELD